MRRAATRVVTAAPPPPPAPPVAVALRTRLQGWTCAHTWGGCSAGWWLEGRRRGRCWQRQGRR